jgi:hypothetical protein
MSCMTCHVAVQNSMWHFSIGPHTDRKMPKMGDMWQPLVFPHHHVDVIMKCVDLLLCHVPYMDVDVSSTDVDSSLLTGLG